MMSRFVALLCLSVVGCSHDSRPPETANNTAEWNASTEPAATGREPKLQPASYEGQPEPSRATASPRTQPSAPPTRAVEGALPAKEPVSTMSEPAKSEPSNSADAATQPDNTKVNERDRSSNALTPMDQGNSESDLKLTQSIRRAVMADKALSFTAKNVKIITKDGKVTLRGPVKTAEERAAIEADARNAAGSASIDNQIEVKK
jgi:hypothetical protein